VVSGSELTTHAAAPAVTAVCCWWRDVCPYNSLSLEQFSLIAQPPDFILLHSPCPGHAAPPPHLPLRR